MTSHDVVNTMRRALRTRAVGHAGTLDPMATGVLVVLAGEATKLSAHLTNDDKSYVAKIFFGKETDSLDADGAVTRELPAPPRTAEEISKALDGFLGPQSQKAPAISAIKRDGVPLYERARRGEVVDAPTRDVVVRELKLLHVAWPEIDVELRVSKGFYVRSFARDVGEALSTCAHLTSLRRLSSGAFGIEHAIPWSDVEAARNNDDAHVALLARALSLADACRALGALTLDAKGADDATHGRIVLRENILSANEHASGEIVTLFSEAGTPLALARKEEAGYRVARGFVA